MRESLFDVTPGPTNLSLMDSHQTQNVTNCFDPQTSLDELNIFGSYLAREARTELSDPGVSNFINCRSFILPRLCKWGKAKTVLWSLSSLIFYKDLFYSTKSYTALAVNNEQLVLFMNGMYMGTSASCHWTYYIH